LKTTLKRTNLLNRIFTGILAVMILATFLPATHGLMADQTDTTIQGAILYFEPGELVHEIWVDVGTEFENMGRRRHRV